MAEHFVPNNQPAPPPRRTAVPNLPEGFQPQPDPGYAEPQRYAEPSPQVPVYVPQFQSTPPPPNPGEAVREDEYNHRIGELTNAIGRIEENYQRILEEQAIRHESQMAAMLAQAGFTNQPQSQNPSNAAQPWDPAAPVTAGQAAAALDAVRHLARAEAKADYIRYSWDVSPVEEAAVLGANPHFNNISEPARTEYIQRAALLGRKRQGPATNTQAPAPSAPAAQRPLAARTVPHVEAQTTPHAQDLVPTNAASAANAEYERAKQIPDRRQRLTAMKQAFNKSRFAQGLTDEVLGHSQFVHRS